MSQGWIRMRVSFVSFVIIVAGLLLSSLSAAASECETVRQSIAALGTELKVAAEKRIVSAGEQIRLQWRSTAAQKPLPAYLLVAFDGAVRFEGNDFYALLPGAKGPFGITAFDNRTRAIIPYSGPEMPHSGEIVARALASGPLYIRWAVVGHDGCKEMLVPAGSGEISLDVRATGIPQIVLNRFLSADQPQQRIFSPAGDRIIEVYANHYRLVDKDGRNELANQPGSKPNFSPTGRFVGANEAEGMHILDAIDGKTVYREARALELAWEHNDSFAITSQFENGTLSILMPIHNPPLLLEGSGYCRACPGTRANMRVDLENNVAVESGYSASAIPLSGMVGVQGSAEAVIAFVKRQSPIAAFKLPQGWEFRGEPKFSHVAESSDENEENPVKKFFVEPRSLPVAPAKGDRLDAAAIIKWRGSAGKVKARPQRTILRRLRDFGLPVPESAIDATMAKFRHERLIISPDLDIDPNEAKKLKGVVRRIRKEINFAGQVFGNEEVTEGAISRCRIDDETQVHPQFQTAFRFQSADRIIWLTHYICHEGSGAYGYPSLVLFDSTSGKAWFVHLETRGLESSEGVICSVSISNCYLNASISDSGLLILSSNESRAIEIFDINSHKNMFTAYDLPRGDLLKDALISDDKKVVLQLNTDGSLAAFSADNPKKPRDKQGLGVPELLSDGQDVESDTELPNEGDLVARDPELLLEGQYIDDEIVVWTSDGQFDATAEGANFVELRLPGRPENYTFEQFSAQLKKPGLLATRLTGGSSPIETLSAPPTLIGTIQRRAEKVRVAATASSEAPLAELLIFEDGLLTKRLEAKGQSTSWNFDLDVLEGTRWLSMIALDRSGLASMPMGRDLGASPTRRVHLLSIGIDEYADPAIKDLEFAAEDARRFESAIRSDARVQVVSNAPLIDKGATRNTILQRLQETVAAAEPGDTIVLFFAGHGIAGKNNAYFLATHDTHRRNLEKSALKWSDVAEILSKSRTRIAVFLDSCHSGSASAKTFAPNDGATSSLLERVPSGIVVFSASKGREESQERNDVNGGIFTVALTNVLASQRNLYDTNHNGAIELSELYRGVKEQVSTLGPATQTPWIARNQMVGDFVLF